MENHQNHDEFVVELEKVEIKKIDSLLKCGDVKAYVALTYQR